MLSVLSLSSVGAACAQTCRSYTQSFLPLSITPHTRLTDSSDLKSQDSGPLSPAALAAAPLPLSALSPAALSYPTLPAAALASSSLAAAALAS